jgi:amino acid transporter
VEEAGGDIKSVGKTVVLSVGLACVFYAILIFCFGYAWDWTEFVGMERPAAATMFLSLFPNTAGTILYWLVTVGAIAGLFTTWNGFYTASANLLMAMARARMIPAIFAKQNKNGIAVNGLILVLVLSICGPFLGANMIDTVTCFSALAFVVSWTITALSLLHLRKTMPNANRPVKLNTGLAYYAAVAACVYLIGLVLPVSPFFVGKVALLAFVGYFVIGVVLFAAASGRRKELTAKEREHQMFGDLDLDAMRAGGTAQGDLAES